ncbi:interleukin-2 [Phyllostomus discolor]|uniref:Interleukin-2 n=1 Tax=Phyllostomus discolor TaxID=89673 RepID=A0A6J2MAK8_9CHIR|nr:interleukin-2 [Phyllostomus discolor]
MYKMHFLTCVALTLAFVVDGAPTSGSHRDARQKLADIKEDLQKLLKGVHNYKNHEHSTMLTFKFYIPRKVTELKHLLCLTDELNPLKDVLNLTQRKTFHLEEMVRSVENINVTVNALAVRPRSLLAWEERGRTHMGPTCEYDDETVTFVEFLNKWVTFCQSIFSTLN